MHSVYLIGVAMSAFGKRPETGFKALAEEGLNGVLADAGLENGQRIQSIWFANSGMGAVGQGSIRGQVCLSNAFNDGRLTPGAPIINVENACASASTALHGAWKDVLSGQARMALAIGLEKLFNPEAKSAADKAKALQSFAAGADMLEPQTWIGYYQKAASDLGLSFGFGPDRSPFIDTYGLQAQWSMRHEGLKREHLAAAAAKAHTIGALNPLAQYRFAMTAEDVLADRMVSDPLTRAMCAPIGDGVAAAIICDAETLATLDDKTRARAVKIRASVLGGGFYRTPEEEGVIELAAARAFAQAGVSPSDIVLAEVHDATTYGEIHIPEALGLCARGEAGALALAGETAPSGRMPINPSGGLVCRGHPVGATGLAMIYELVSQMRGECGARQVPAPALALAQNGGGVMGFDEAVSAITILEAA